MSSIKTDYEIVAIGNIQIQAVQDSRTEKLIAQNHDAIEEVWEKTMEERGGKLFNGTLPNFVGLDKNGAEIVIRGTFVEYKHFLAQRKRPDLNLSIKPIGVSGIIILKEADREYVIFAKRANDTTEYPGFFELVPSGTLSKECVKSNGFVDYKSKLLSEFEEETGLSQDCVRDIIGFAFVLDTHDNVYDVCCKIIINIEKDVVISKLSNSKEYQSPVFIATDEITNFIKLNSGSIVPTSLALVEAFCRTASK